MESTGKFVIDKIRVCCSNLFGNVEDVVKVVPAKLKTERMKNYMIFDRTFCAEHDNLKSPTTSTDWRTRTSKKIGGRRPDF